MRTQLPGLAAAMEAAGFSVGQLAEALGVTHAAVSQWRSGANSPTLANVQKLASVLGVSIDDLVGPAKEPTA